MSDRVYIQDYTSTTDSGVPEFVCYVDNSGVGIGTCANTNKTSHTAPGTYKTVDCFSITNVNLSMRDIAIAKSQCQ